MDLEEKIKNSKIPPGPEPMLIAGNIRDVLESTLFYFLVTNSRPGDAIDYSCFKAVIPAIWSDRKTYVIW